LAAHQIGGHFRQSINFGVSPTVFDRKVLAFYITRILQALAECIDNVGVCGSDARMHEANNPHRRLLRAYGQRPRPSAPEQRYELAPFHSIEMHLLPQPETSQKHTALARIRLGARCSAEFRPT